MTKGQKKPELAIEISSSAERSLVVTESRLRWKLRHSQPTELMIRMVRFIWMRSPFPWENRFGLHSSILGACLRNGFLEHRGKTLEVTQAGEDLILPRRRSEGLHA